jgi:hypothetical protein
VIGIGVNAAFFKAIGDEPLAALGALEAVRYARLHARGEMSFLKSPFFIGKISRFHERQHSLPPESRREDARPAAPFFYNLKVKR